MYLHHSAACSQIVANKVCIAIYDVNTRIKSNTRFSRYVATVFPAFRDVICSISNALRDLFFFLFFFLYFFVRFGFVSVHQLNDVVDRINCHRFSYHTSCTAYFRVLSVISELHDVQFDGCNVMECF